MVRLRQISRLALWVIGCGLCYYGAAVFEVSAHANLVTSIPFPGQRLILPDLIEEIRLSFDEEVGQGSSFVIFDRQFQPIDVAVGIDNSRPTDLIGAMPTDLEIGQYTIQWLVISQDGHPIEGTFSFNIEDGESNMELVALAEEVSHFNPANWVAVVMVLLAIFVPFILYRTIRK